MVVFPYQYYLAKTANSHQMVGFEEGNNQVRIEQGEVVADYFVEAEAEVETEPETEAEMETEIEVQL